MKLVMHEPGVEPCRPANDLMVLVACEDFNRGQEVCARLERAGNNAITKGRLIHALWNFEALAIPALRQVAAGEAAQADLILLIAADGASLPAAIIDWMNLWLAVKECRPQVLVALLDSAAGRDGFSRRILAQLKDVAGLGRIDFFAEGLDGELESVLAFGIRAVLRRKHEQRTTPTNPKPHENPEGLKDPKPGRRAEAALFP